MAYAIQLELFESNDELSLTKRELDLVKKELANVRRGVFYRLNALREEFENKFNKQQDELDVIKSKMHPKAEMLGFPTSKRRKSC